MAVEAVVAEAEAVAVAPAVKEHPEEEEAVGAEAKLPSSWPVLREDVVATAVVVEVADTAVVVAVAARAAQAVTEALVLAHLRLPPMA